MSGINFNIASSMFNKFAENNAEEAQAESTQSSSDTVQAPAYSKEWEDIDGSAEYDKSRPLRDYSVEEVTNFFNDGEISVEDLESTVRERDGFESWDVTESGDVTVYSYTVDSKSYTVNEAKSPSNRAPAVTDDSEKVSLQLKLSSMGIPENVISQNISDLSELEALANDPESYRGTDLYEKCFGMEAKWSANQIEWMGMNADYVKNDYFTKNSDGTYSLKNTNSQGSEKGVWVEDELVSDIKTLQEKLGVKSFDQYIDEEYVYDRYGIYDSHVVNTDIANLLWRQGVLPTTYGYNTPPEALEKCQEFKENLASKLGKSVDDLSASDIEFEIIAQEKEMGKKYTLEDLSDNFREYNMDILMYDNAYAHSYLGNSYDFDSHYDTKTPCEVFTEVIYNLEENQTDTLDNNDFNNTLWNALLDAADIKDSDDIETRADKMYDLMDKCGGNHIVIRGERTDNPWYNVYDYLMTNGYLKQNSYSETELKRLYDDETISQNFYQVRDEKGNIKVGKDGLPIYQLRKEAGGELPYVESSDYPTEAMTVAEANMHGYTVVDNAKDLKEAVNSNPNAIVVLSDDIDMNNVNWVPVGTEESPFNGKIYGNGCTVSNMNVESSNQYSGMFGVFGGSASDINFDNCKVKDERSKDEPGVGGTGVFAGKITGSCKNVDVKNSDVYGRDNAGLLAGVIEPSETSTSKESVENCSTSGSVYSEHSAGGIAGKFVGTNDNDGYMTMTDCKSDADVNGQVWAGGIVGEIDDAFRKVVRRGLHGSTPVETTKAEYLIGGCEFNGYSINKDISNPPGAVGAGAVCGRMGIPDFVNDVDRIETVSEFSPFPGGYWGTPTGFEYTDFGGEIIGEYYDEETGERHTEYPPRHIYNTYAAANNIGWICSENEDGSVKESQLFPKAGILNYDDVGLCANERDGRIRTYWMRDDETGWFKEDYMVKNAPEVQPESTYSDTVRNGVVKTQTQYVTEPSYNDLVKELILQNFVEHYDVDDPDNQLKLDQLNGKDYLTRANYKGYYDAVDQRSERTKEELKSQAVNKLVSDCTDIGYGNWLLSLINSMDGKVLNMQDGVNRKDDAYVNSSTPPKMDFEVDDSEYDISLKGHDTIVNGQVESTWKKPEYISSSELTERLKKAGATDSQIQSIISEYYKEAVTTKDDNGKNVTMYYFNPQNANNVHDKYGGLFKSTDDIVKYLSNADDDYSHFCNTLANDKDFRAAVNKQVDSYCLGEYGSTNGVVPGVYVYKDFLKDEKGAYIESEDQTHYLYNEKIKVWDPNSKKMIETNLMASDIYDSNGKLNKEALKAAGVSDYAAQLLDMYINKNTDFSSLTSGDTQAPANAPGTESDGSNKSDQVVTKQDYDNKAKENLGELQKYGPVIKSGSIYYTNNNGKKYNFIWDIFDNKWLSYEDSQLTSGVSNEKTSRIKMFLAAFNQGLNFTSNIRVCVDDNGNYYDYDDTKGEYRKRA